VGSDKRNVGSDMSTKLCAVRVGLFRKSKSSPDSIELYGVNTNPMAIDVAPAAIFEPPSKTVTMYVLNKSYWNVNS